MASREEMLAEAYRRGLLDPQQKAAYEEAQRRGLVKRTRKAPSAGEEVRGAMANVNRGLLVGDEIMGALMTAEDVVRGRAVTVPSRPNESPIGMVRTLRSLKATYDRSMERQRGVEDEFAARRPNVANLSKGTGGALTTLVPVGAGGQVAGRLQSVLQGVTVGAAYGAGSGILDRGNLSERVSSANRGAAVGAVTGGVLGGLTGRPAAPAKPRKAVDPNVAALAKEGVRMTPGQMRGGIAKTLEDKATSLPILGDAITKARRTGMEDFTRAPVRRALKEIDDDLPEGVTGNEAIAYAQQAFGRAYDDVKPTGGVAFDQDFGDDLERSLSDVIPTMTPESLQRLRGIVDSRLTSRVRDNQLDGELYKRIQSELQYEIRRFSPGGPDDQAIAQGLKGVSEALKTTAARQNPDFAKRLSDIDRGYAQYKTAEAAAGRTGAEGGVFTPAQYDAAVRSSDRSVDHRRYAAGDAYGQDLADAGRAVLPSSIPDSGTAGRGIVGLALGGGAGAFGGVPGMAATAGGLWTASRGYSPRAIDLANKALNERISRQEAAAIVDELALIAEASPKNAEIYREVLRRLTPAAAATAVTTQSTSER